MNQLTTSICDAIQGGNTAVISSALQQAASSMEYSEQMAFYQNAHSLFLALANISVNRVCSLSQQRVNAMVDSFVQLNQQKQQSTETAIPKKQVFDTTEAMRITGIKTRNTIIKYFKNETIKATQTPNNGLWKVRREDLANYMGTDDF